ncbi:MAG: hypothetical protein R3B93_19105 [Bacteroidia bacterium]
MKNTNLNKILLPIVFLIWIGVLYRIFWYEPKAETVSIPLASKVSLNISSPIEADTLSLSLDYDDPFNLSERKRKKPASHSPAKQSQAKKVAILPKKTAKQEPVLPKPIDWSQFAYKGFSQVSDQAEKTALLTIFGSTRYLGEGDSVSGVKVVMISKDSVGISFRNKNRVLYRE